MPHAAVCAAKPNPALAGRKQRCMSNFKQKGDAVASKLFANLHTVPLKVNGGAYPFARKKTVSEDAVIKRINRILEQQNPGEFLRIKRTRGSRAQQDLGDFYLHNGNRNFVQDTHLDLNEVAKQYKVLSSTEQVEQKA
jgi:hypothetical protein